MEAEAQETAQEEGNGATRPTQRKCIHEKVTSGRFLQKLLRIPFGKSAQEYLQELKERPTAHKTYASAMAYPKGIVESRFWCLDLECHPVQVMEYALKEHVQRILDALQKFDPDFRETIQQ